MVTQVDEQQAAVIAYTVHPARKASGFTYIIRPQLSAGMASITMHSVLSGNLVNHKIQKLVDLVKRSSGWKRHVSLLKSSKSVTLALFLADISRVSSTYVVFARLWLRPFGS